MTWHFNPKKSKKNGNGQFMEEEPEDNKQNTDIRSSKIEIVNGIVFDDNNVVTKGY
jgi:hypothetical protein